MSPRRESCVRWVRAALAGLRTSPCSQSCSCLRLCPLSSSEGSACATARSWARGPESWPKLLLFSAMLFFVKEGTRGRACEPLQLACASSLRPARARDNWAKLTSDNCGARSTGTAVFGLLCSALLVAKTAALLWRGVGDGERVHAVRVLAAAASSLFSGSVRPTRCSCERGGTGVRVGLPIRLYDFVPHCHVRCGPAAGRSSPAVRHAGAAGHAGEPRAIRCLELHLGASRLSAPPPTRTLRALRRSPGGVCWGRAAAGCRSRVVTHALQFMAAVVVGTGIYRGESVLPGPPPAIVGIFIAATTLLWHLEGVQVGTGTSTSTSTSTGVWHTTALVRNDNGVVLHE